MALAVLNVASQARFSPGQLVMTCGIDALVKGLRGKAKVE